MLGACSPLYKKASVPPLPHSTLKDLLPVEVFSILKDKYGGYKVLKGEGAFSLRYQEKKIVGKGIVLAKRTGSFRLDILGPFLQPVYVIVYHEGLMSFLSLREKKLYRGFGGMNLYTSTNPFPIRPSSFLSFLFGELPSTSIPSTSPGTTTFFSGRVVDGGMDANKNLYFLEILSTEGLTYKTWIHPQKVLMVEGELYNSKGDLVSSVKVDGFDTINGKDFPKRVIGKYPNGTILTVEFQKVSLMEDVKDEVFKLFTPPGIEEFDF